MLLTERDDNHAFLLSAFCSNVSQDDVEYRSEFGLVAQGHLDSDESGAFDCTGDLAIDFGDRAGGVTWGSVGGSGEFAGNGALGGC